jgi:linoleoyl-CoA desaturase
MTTTPLSFEQHLSERVRQHMAHRSKTGDAYSSIKTTVLIVLFLTSYLLWLAYPEILTSICLGTAVSLIGFNVLHDASHGGLSKYRSLNSWLAHGFDLFGISSTLWNIKHNVNHHTHVNNTDLDPDIDQNPYLVLSPHQKKHWWHREQYWYAFVLYGFSYVSWSLFDDFKTFHRGTLQGHPIEKTPRTIATFYCGKLVFVTLFIVLPCIANGIYNGCRFFLVFAMVCGLVTSITFQLAHAVPTSDFALWTRGGTLSKERYQIGESLDFAVGSRFWNWIFGGLNHQTIHHLYPNISHRHYPALAQIVRSVCKEHRVPYNQTSIVGAFRLHVLHLYMMGHT